LVASVLRFPVQVVFGEGCLQELGPLARNFGKHALLITGGGATSHLPAIDSIRKILGEENIVLSHFAEVEADPSVETVEKGAGFAAENGCDFIIGLGGGSPMDAAKVIAARMNNEGEIASWEGVGKIPRRSRPLICIPTTSGTGSEATSVAVISGGKRHHKMSLVSQTLYPILAIVDPELTYGLPPRLTASTAMDALTHAIESYVARKAWPPTQVLSYKAVQFIFSNLERACADGSDVEARRQLSLASFMAGMAFTNAGLGVTHALAYALGSHFGIPHGEATALILSHVIRFNLEICPGLYRELAEAMGVHVSGLPAIRAAEIAAQAVEELATNLPLPENLNAVGISENSVETLAAEAFLNTRFRSSNPRDTILEDLVQILHNAFI
jgi:alcohol dehydrogenase